MGVLTKYFGELAGDAGLRVHFPAGIPAFEQETEFLLLAPPDAAPVVFLQSTLTPAVCFFAMPVQRVIPEYELSIGADDLQAAGFACASMLASADAVVLAILTFEGDQTMANLLAPVIINVPRGVGVQAVRADRLYSHCHPVPAEAIEASLCS